MFHIVAALSSFAAPIKVGIIGLDAHAMPWTQIIHGPNAPPPISDLRIVAAVPAPSADIPVSQDNIEKNTARMRALGVAICDTSLKVRPGERTRPPPNEVKKSPDLMRAKRHFIPDLAGFLAIAVLTAHSSVAASEALLCETNPGNGWLVSLRRAGDTNHSEFLRYGQALGPVILRVRTPGGTVA